jgi:hypothetical protein
MNKTDSEIINLAQLSRQQRKISVKMPLKRIFLLLDALQEFDSAVHSKCTLFKTFGVLFIIAGFFSFILEAVFIGLIIIMLGAICLIIASNYKSLDLSNEFRDYLNPLLTVLKDDIKESSDISLNIYLSSLKSQPFLKKTGEEKKIGNYNCTDYFYSRNFLTLKLPLFDGSTLFLAGNEFLRHQIRRRMTGKPKTKVKFASRSSFSIRIRYDASKYTHRKFMMEKGKSQNFELSKKDSPKGTILIMNFDNKYKGASISYPDPKMTLENMARLYSYLQPLNTEKK